MTRLPPVPPENQSKKGTGHTKAVDTDDTPENKGVSNLHQEGQTANTRQNTTHQGNQQAR